jgi:hypothetical protein
MIGEWEFPNMKAYLGYDKIRCNMKRKSNNASANGTVQINAAPLSTRWINCSLSDKDVAEIEGAEFSLEHVGVGLLSMCVGGWDITVKRDNKSGGFTCMGFASDPFVTGGNVALSGWSGDVASACVVFLYKYHQCLDATIPEPSEAGKRRFR